jgi:hypothetical protein
LRNDESGDQPSGLTREDPLLWLTLRQQFLTPPLRLKLLGFLPDTRLLVKLPPLQFAEESFSREFLLGNFEGFLDVIIEDFDFHGSRLRAFPGDACINFSPVPNYL